MKRASRGAKAPEREARTRATRARATTRTTPRGTPRARVAASDAPRAGARATTRSAGASERDAPRVRSRATRSPETAAVLSLKEFLALSKPAGDVAVDVEGTTVDLTSLDRVYWPKEKITKHELLSYYIQVWPHIGPFLENRPAILQRYPRGIALPKFFQHDLNNAPRYVTTKTMPNEEGRMIDYAVYTSLASLLYLANLGTLEHHPWHSRVDDLDRPDWLTLDLDPGRAPWRNVLQVARVTREVCEDRGYMSYPKTSGSKGIHIYIPLRREYGYDAVAATAHALATEIASRAPKVATVERSKAGRSESQVYVDWLQNARGKSMAAPFSVRARPGAPVSAPLTWSDIEEGVEILDFTLRNVRGTAAACTAAWKGFFKKRQKIT
jgi:bifunctional non-homologous end joining protein LigD